MVSSIFIGCLCFRPLTCPHLPLPRDASIIHDTHTYTHSHAPTHQTFFSATPICYKKTNTLVPWSLTLPPPPPPPLQAPPLTFTHARAHPKPTYLVHLHPSSFWTLAFLRFNPLCLALSCARGFHPRQLPPTPRARSQPNFEGCVKKKPVGSTGGGGFPLSHSLQREKPALRKRRRLFIHERARQKMGGKHDKIVKYPMYIL